MMLEYFRCDSTWTVVNGAYDLSDGCSGEMIGGVLFYVCGSHGISTPWPTKD